MDIRARIQLSYNVYVVHDFACLFVGVAMWLFGGFSNV